VSSLVRELHAQQLVTIAPGVSGGRRASMVTLVPASGVVVGAEMAQLRQAHPQRSVAGSDVDRGPGGQCSADRDLAAQHSDDRGQVAGSVVLWWADPQVLADPFEGRLSLTAHIVTTLVR
jgi:hypothetical protein